MAEKCISRALKGQRQCTRVRAGRRSCTRDTTTMLKPPGNAAPQSEPLLEGTTAGVAVGTPGSTDKIKNTPTDFQRNKIRHFCSFSDAVNKSLKGRGRKQSRRRYSCASEQRKLREPQGQRARGQRRPVELTLRCIQAVNSPALAASGQVCFGC